MWPSRFVWLDHLPLTPNGKVARQQLPAPSADREPAVVAAAMTATESRLATMWRDVLHIDEVGPGDNFFSLGGHSLAASDLIFRVAREFGVHLTMHHFYESQDLAALAREVDRMATPGTDAIGAFPAAPTAPW
jgi:acyl carrier protein